MVKILEKIQMVETNKRRYRKYELSKKKLNFLKEKTSSLNIFSGEFYQMLKVK